VSVEDVLNMMIFGIPDTAPAMYEIFTHNAVCWLGTHARVLQFEELLRHVKALETDAAEAFFAVLFEQLNMGELPDDWRERIRIGSDREQSTTARENLSRVTVDVPNELPDIQKRMVDFAAPGLRAILGYE
jgi:isopenicillin N synthase-like dioxygenase